MEMIIDALEKSFERLVVTVTHPLQQKQPLMETSEAEDYSQS